MWTRFVCFLTWRAQQMVEKRSEAARKAYDVGVRP